MMDDDPPDDGPGQGEIDESLTLLERIERFCATGALVLRLVLVRELAACAEQVGVSETVGRLVPLLKVIVCDPELSVRQALAEETVGLANVLLTEPEARAGGGGPGEMEETSGPTAYECVLTELVPLLTSILGSGAQELSAGGASSAQPLAEAASEALLGLAALIQPADVGETVLRAVLCLAHDNEIEENRVVATQLLGSLAPVLGPELCRQYVLPDLVCLADDPAFRVRKAAALRVGAVSVVVGPELTVGKLLPVYEVLARDEIWGVRKASVESLSQVAAVMPLDVRTGSLERLVHEFHGDSSRWVRIAACQALGPFIATLPSDAISPQLLALFTNLANPANRTDADSDVAYSCAYNLPGVAQAVGAARWPEVADSFATLAGNIQWKVRRTLSCSLHDLASVLGPELTESELLPTFDLFIKDLDEVKVGVIQNLAAFIGALTPTTRLQYLPVLAEIRAETDNWRFRHLLASQLAAFGAAYPRGAVHETLLPLALSLCTDAVAQVRLAAVSQVGKLVQLLVSEPDTVPADAAGADADGAEAAVAEEAVRSFVDTVCSMARAPSCYKRANCVQICASLLDGLPTALASDVLLPALVPLAHDRVANVRLALAQLVKSKLLPEGSPFADGAHTQQLVDTLRVDRDRDVLRAVHPDGYVPPRYRGGAGAEAAEAAARAQEQRDDDDYVDDALAASGADADEAADVDADAAAEETSEARAEADETAEAADVLGEEPAATEVMAGLRLHDFEEPDVGARAE